ncbi:myophilin-like [Gigantopelta aegis]|uniref:myophilin-like n=1 Tax=Gigantopelta aegis TaxID=1735272 RepID=UPI001B88B73C|nr:myophilin-like [Gigantopelta aegis]
MSGQSYRATKSGFAAEAQSKILKKYDPDLAKDVLEWINKVLRHGGHDQLVDASTGEMHHFAQQLHDGVVIARVANVIAPGSIPANKLKSAPTMSFKQMELIGLAIDGFKKFGVPDHEMFATVDLYESQNLNQVVCALSSCGRKLSGPLHFGPKESEANVRNFSEEQLKAGQNVIGLQMGTNKGASQAGMNMGNMRHIVD